MAADWRTHTRTRQIWKVDPHAGGCQRALEVMVADWLDSESAMAGAAKSGSTIQFHFVEQSFNI
jgi:hypothetical protein